jgi:polyphenol oxidase
MRETVAMSVALEWQEPIGVPVLIGRADDVPGVRAAFTCRLGGVSEAPYDSLNLSSFVGDDDDRVAVNRERALGAAAMGGRPIALVKQVHGDRIIEAGGRSGVLGEGDGVAATRGGGAACVMSADCVPVLLAGRDEVIAVHAGWRGLVGGVIDRALERMGSVSAAWIGPSIKGCCYEVGSDVIDAFDAAGLPTLSGSVDPGAAAARILTRAGVDEFALAMECTSCDPRFFSHRRDGITGRQGGLIAWA